MGRQQQPLEHRLLLTATFCLLAGGAVMVYSASSARTLLQGQGDGTMYLVKYVGYGFFGLIAMYIDLAAAPGADPALHVAAADGRVRDARDGQDPGPGRGGQRRDAAGSGSARCSSSRARS